MINEEIIEFAKTLGFDNSNNEKTIFSYDFDHINFKLSNINNQLFLHNDGYQTPIKSKKKLFETILGHMFTHGTISGLRKARELLNKL